MYQIQGECNRCGQCCGAPGSPNRDSPWPNNWPEAVRNWSISALQTHLPMFTVTGHPDLGGQRAFAARIGNKTYRGIWIPGHGLCADAAPFGDESAYEEQCPFLGAQQPDDSYPCGLVGTPFEAVHTIQCAPMGEFWSDTSVEEWQTNHPLCSYEFVEV